MNAREMKQTAIRVFKFMLIGIIPNIFLYYFFGTKLQEWLLTIISVLIFVACAFIGEVIYNKIKNKQIIEELAQEAEQQKKEGEK